MLRTITLAAAGVALLMGVAAWLAWRSYSQFAETPLQVPAQGAVLLVEEGMTGRAVVGRLAVLGIAEPDWRWRLLLRLEPAVLQAGEYRLNPNMTPRDLLALLEIGDVIQYRFTIVEGWTVRQLLAALAAHPRLGTGLSGAAAEPDIETIVPGYQNPEGWFLPETYAYVRGDDYRAVLQRAHAAMREALEQAWQARIDDHPVATAYELLVLASIIEKETGLDGERAHVSGVFVRRLRRGMRLQTDPTVIYGLGEAFDGDIRRRDLDADTPYNTYTRHGLPPTPIALPGQASLMAAARPAPGEALYFVANGKGGHTFSATLEEHEKAVNKLLGRTP